MVGPLDRGGEKDDRHVAVLSVPLDLGGGLEAVHPRHHDVKQDDRELLGEQRVHGLLAGSHGHENLVERGKDCLQRDQVLNPVVNEKDPGLPRHWFPSLSLPTAPADLAVHPRWLAVIVSRPRLVTAPRLLSPAPDPFGPRSSLLGPRSSLLGPRSSLLGPRS